MNYYDYHNGCRDSMRTDVDNDTYEFGVRSKMKRVNKRRHNFLHSLRSTTRQSLRVEWAGNAHQLTAPSTHGGKPIK